MNKFISVKDAAIKWNISERSVRNYCASKRIPGTFLNSLNVWMIPSDAKKPIRSNNKENKKHLLERLRFERTNRFKGGMYEWLLVNFTFNSNHIEGNELTLDDVNGIYHTRTVIAYKNTSIRVDGIVETVNHFTAIDRVIDFANYELSEKFIKELHKILKENTNDSRLSYFALGDYKKIPNVVGGMETTHPRLVANEMKKLVDGYNAKKYHTFEEIVEFHVNFERIHPFQDGNGRVGRLIALKECLKNNIVPFIILDNKKEFYYRGLKNWNDGRGWLIDTCLDGQDTVKKYLDYFTIPYKE